MNPIIKFTTLFGLLAVELALKLGSATKLSISIVSFVIALTFVYRSFYGMRIHSGAHDDNDPPVQQSEPHRAPAMAGSN
jgi:K(+)-stimulated pyrophosphate-energized sodium pump